MSSYRRAATTGNRADGDVHLFESANDPATLFPLGSADSGDQPDDAPASCFTAVTDDELSATHSAPPEDLGGEYIEALENRLYAGMNLARLVDPLAVKLRDIPDHIPSAGQGAQYVDAAHGNNDNGRIMPAFHDAQVAGPSRALPLPSFVNYDVVGDMAGWNGGESSYAPAPGLYATYEEVFNSVAMANNTSTQENNVPVPGAYGCFPTQSEPPAQLPAHLVSSPYGANWSTHYATPETSSLSPLSQYTTLGSNSGNASAPWNSTPYSTATDRRPSICGTRNRPLPVVGDEYPFVQSTRGDDVSCGSSHASHEEIRVTPQVAMQSFNALGLDSAEAGPSQQSGAATIVEGNSPFPTGATGPTQKYFICPLAGCRERILVILKSDVYNHYKEVDCSNPTVHVLKQQTLSSGYKLRAGLTNKTAVNLKCPARGCRAKFATIGKWAAHPDRHEEFYV